jgi:beta-fructofuranosidase
VKTTRLYYSFQQEEIIYAIKKAADYHQYFTYTHYSDQQLTIEWDEDAADMM